MVAKKIQKKEYERGILICGSGYGHGDCSQQNIKGFMLR